MGRGSDCERYEENEGRHGYRKRKEKIWEGERGKDRSLVEIVPSVYEPAKIQRTRIAKKIHRGECTSPKVLYSCMIPSAAQQLSTGRERETQTIHRQRANTKSGSRFSRSYGEESYINDSSSRSRG